MRDGACRFPRILSGFVFAIHAGLALAAQPVLTWNGAPGEVWDASAANWLDESVNAVTWQPGAAARFAGAGGMVNVAGDIAVSNITFATGGYALLGSGHFALEGEISAAATTTNSIATKISAAGGLTKTGGGALALARCAGPLVVQEGSLLASGTFFADAAISVASGAALVTLGEPSSSANLLLNPGFEEPALAAGTWAYRDIPGWTRSANAGNVGMKNTVAAGEWALTGASPEGVQMAIVQGGGALSQTVTVPADGLYAVAFSYMMRNQIPAKTNQVYVSLGGVPLAAFLNRSPQTGAPGRFASGALWLPAGTYTLTVAGEPAHSWADCTTLLDAVCFAPPSAAEPCRALGGDSTLALVTGASAVLSHSGTAAATLVAVNGASVAGGFTYDASHLSGIFSGPGALAAQPPEDTFIQAAAGGWSTAATWQSGTAPAAGGGNALLLQLTADSVNDLPGGFLARRVQLTGAGPATLSGNDLALTGPLSQPTPGSWNVSAPVTATAVFSADIAGDVTLSQPLGIRTNGFFIKDGAGNLTLAAFTNGFGSAHLYGGTVSLPALPATPAIWELYASDGCPATLRFTAPGTITRRLNLYGSGSPTLAVDAGGGTVILSDWTVAFGANAVFDVAANNTLSLRQLLRSRLDNGMASAPTLVKTGAGTLEIRSAGVDTDRNRAYPGTTVLRNGTLTLSEDDWGTLSGVGNTFNNRTYAATGGSLGYSLLTNAVIVGDSATAPTDHLALIANGDRRWIGHDIEVFNVGNTVTLGMTTGTVMFAGTVILHRDIALAGPADGTVILNDLVFASDFAGTGELALTGLASLVVEGALPPGASLMLQGRALRFGTHTIRDQTLNALTLGDAATPAALDVDFGLGANDIIRVTAADGLALGSAAVNLMYASTGLPFAEPGTYTLLTYEGNLTGAPATTLSVANPQTGAQYAFADDTLNRCVTLTISGTPDGVDAVWSHKSGGDWGTGANWSTGTAPNGADVVPLFGAAITNPATVNLEAAHTVGGLLFNGAYSYTVGGNGGLTFADSDITPRISILAGTHTLDTALSSPDGLDIETADNAALAFGPDTSVDAAALTLARGTLILQGNAAVNGATTLAGETLLRAISTTNAAIGTLTSAASAAVTLTGTAPTLTVNQSGDSLFGGTLSGPADATFIKTGNGTLTLSGAVSPLLGRASVETGTLALRSAALPAATDVGADAALTVASPATNGLTGFFYNITPNTNTFWTLSAMESHFATLTPDFAALSGASSNLFDFGVGTPFAFAGPYASNGSRPGNFEAVWRGSLTVPASGTYVFGVYGDDGYLLAIDGRQLLGCNFWSSAWTEASVPLQAGRHDIVLGYFQGTGGGGIRMRVRQPNQSTADALPNAWLTPYTQTGPLSGNGALALPAADSLLRANVATGIASYGGPLSGASGALLAKNGSGILNFTSGTGTANAFSGNVDAQAGLLTFDADERLADTAALNVRADATLAFAGTETVGSLAGAGTLAIGSYVYAIPFTDETDCGLSSDKTYTHLLDFPANGNSATVNGVTFTAAGASGSVGGYAWAFSGSVPTGTLNSSPDDSTRTGIDRLLWDFQYGAQGNSTLTLSGLTPGKAYETRLYFRNYGNSARLLDFTFAAGGHEAGRLTYNPDTGAKGSRSWVGCRYAADAAGSVSITITNRSTTDTCHFYGLSNEELAAAAVPALTVAPAAGTSARFAGTVTGLGTLVIDGAGEQRFSGPLTLPNPLDVRAGTAALDPGAALPNGATLAAGATLKVPLGSVTLGAISGEGTFDLTGAADYAVTNGPHFVAITSDADCGVSPDKTYTHLIDFGGSTALAVVNGVSFNKEKAVNGPAFGASWTNAPVTGTHAGGNPTSIGVAPGQGIYNLLNDFGYNGPYGTLYLTGLTTGKTYEVRFYHRKWENTKARNTTFTFDPDGAGPVSDAISFNPDSPAGSPNDNYLAYRYVAQTNRLAVAIACPNADKYHMYGLSNEEVPAAEDGATTLDIAGETRFGGTLSGPGALVKTGAGHLLFTGASTASGPVTVAAGALGAAFADAAAPLTSGTVTFAPGTALVYTWSSLFAGGTLTAGTVILPADGFTILAGDDTQPPATWPVIVSQDAPLAPALEDITLQGFSKSVTAQYSEDRRILYLKNPRGTLLLLQ
jgi:autotransporter-associated beta strand protein